MATWCTLRKVEELRGITKRAQEGRIRRGVWRRGFEWALVDGVRMIDLDAVDRRCDAAASQQASGLGAPASARKITRLV